jgi:hypothetical protein
MVGGFILDTNDVSYLVSTIIHLIAHHPTSVFLDILAKVGCNAYESDDPISL